MHTYRSSPVIVDGLDDEAQGWTDAVHVLIHDLLDDCCLPGVVQSTVHCQHRSRRLSGTLTASGFSSPCLSDELCGVWTAYSQTNFRSR